MRKKDGCAYDLRDLAQVSVDAHARDGSGLEYREPESSRSQPEMMSRMVGEAEDDAMTPDPYPHPDQ